MTAPPLPPTTADDDTPALPPAESSVTLSAGQLSVGGDVVGRDKVTIVQELTTLPGLPTDYGTRIQNFLHEYLGTPDERVPFGGRAQELKRLDSWLPRKVPRPTPCSPRRRGAASQPCSCAGLATWRQGGEVQVVFAR